VAEAKSKGGTQQSVADQLRASLSDRNSIIDTSLPTAAFLVGYLVSGSQLAPALWTAVAAGVLVAILRIVRKQSLQHVLSGFLGVAIAALIARQTGRAEDFFLPGLLLNIAYAAAFAISAVIRRPLVGLGIALLSGDGGAWRQDPRLRSAAMQATWVWAGVFGIRVAIQLPLYLTGAVGVLGVAKLVLGFPLFALGALITYRLLQPALAERARREAAAESSCEQCVGCAVLTGDEADAAECPSVESADDTSV